MSSIYGRVLWNRSSEASDIIGIKEEIDRIILDKRLNNLEKCNFIRSIIELYSLGCFVDKINMSITEETEIIRQLQSGLLEKAYEQIIQLI